MDRRSSFIKTILTCAVILGVVSSPSPVLGMSDCRLTGASGDVAPLLRASGEIVIVGRSLELLRSDPTGEIWTSELVPLDCRWPGITEVDDRLIISRPEEPCVRFRPC